jgi:hypothetical protein
MKKYNGKGRPPNPNGEMFVISARVYGPLLAEIRAYAAAQDRSVCWTAAQLLKAGIDAMNEKKQTT